MNNVITEVRQALKENATGKDPNKEKRLFKEEINLYGVSIPTVNKLSKEYFSKISGLSKNEIFALCEELWKSDYNEEEWMACNWSYYIHDRYEPSDFEVFDHWLNEYVGNWASCDTLCNHTVAELVEMYPDFVQKLKAWAHSANRWVRRGAAVTLIIPARKGLFLEDIFEIADLLLTDPDDLVQKGYGWMLKAASQAYPQAVFEYVQSKKSVMPRTALRYAIEKLSPELRAEAMKK